MKNLTNYHFMRPIRKTVCLLAGALALTLMSCEKEDKTVAVESIAFEETSLTLTVGQSTVPSVTILPENATDKTYSLTSSDESVLAVSGEEISAVSFGDAVLTATLPDGSLKTECNVTVIPEG